MGSPMGTDVTGAAEADRSEARPNRRQTVRTIAGTAAGNALEWYDRNV